MKIPVLGLEHLLECQWIVAAVCVRWVHVGGQ